MMITHENFKKTLGQFVTGVSVITTVDASNKPAGVTINSLTSVSLDPPLILFCLNKKSHLITTFEKTDYFAANVLTLDQSEISNAFARNLPHKWDLTRSEKHSKGILIFKDTQATIICEKFTHYDGGDHMIFLGKVIELKTNPNKTPLVYFQGQYTHI